MKAMISGIVFVVVGTLLGCLLELVFKTKNTYIYAFSFGLLGTIYGMFQD